MAHWLDKLKKRFEKHQKTVSTENKRVMKKQVYDQKIGRKFLSPAQHDFFSSLTAALFHPLTFIRGGLNAALQQWNPAVIDGPFSKLLNQPLYQYWWNYFHKKELLHSIYWMGIPAYKSVFDLWIYQEIIFEKKPDFIIEIGSYHGGSTLFLAQMLDLTNHGQVISIDIDRTPFRAKHSRIIEIEGDCSDPVILKKIVALIQNKSVMVIHDGDHSLEACIRDLELYAPLVSLGQYFVMEDGVFELYNQKRVQIQPHQSGPISAIHRFISDHPHAFQIDSSREKFILTSNPYGYLLKTGEL